jgi:hypothetical protein
MKKSLPTRPPTPVFDAAAGATLTRAADARVVPTVVRGVMDPARPHLLLVHGVLAPPPMVITTTLTNTLTTTTLTTTLTNSEGLHR